MKTTTIRTFFTVFCGVFLTQAMLSSHAYAQTLEDYSLLPETMVSPPDQTPNILFIVDSSGSMRLGGEDTHVGAHDPTSRSFAVRQVLRSLLTNNEDQLNVGLMTFGGTGEINEGPYSVDNCGGFTGCGTEVNRWFRPLTGRGVLLSNLTPLTDDKVTEINAIIATEPELPVLSADEIDHWSNFWGYYSQANTIYENGVLLSNGGTPLTGALESASRYLVDQALPADEISIANGDTVSYLQSTPGIVAECRPNTFVFLITDGDPTINNTGNSVDIAAEVPNVANAAGALRTAGIDTFVFGFNVPNAANMDTISQAGSGRNAFISNDAATLEAQILAALEEVKQTGGSSSGVSVVASSAEGAGSVVQAIYSPELEIDTGVVDPNNAGETLKETVYWNSTLSAYFLDDFGYLREDDGDGQLEDYGSDGAFRLEFNTVTREVEVVRFTPTNIGLDTFEEVETETVTLDDLNPIWEAGSLLSDYPQTDVLNPDINVYGSRQRPYGNVASNTLGYRHIISWMQNNPRNTLFDQGQTLDFLFTDANNAATINARNFQMLDAGGDTVEEEKDNVQKIIRFIRGEEGIPDFRTRTANGQAFLLGDIVHSTAVQVDKPNQNFDSLGDDSYRAFRQHWEDQDRRRMVYVGGNDGMLHAFNGGFWDGESRTFSRSSDALTGEAEHELGAEIWSYVPMNVLPHLKFLADPAYTSANHVAYVDGAVQSFDVRIFPEDADHVNGWGTIIVVGMRFGGGEYPGLDFNANNANNPDYTARSAYLILDVTNPEKPPVPMGEVTHGSLGFTTGLSTVSRENCNSNNVCDWFLVFGSGPNELETATSTRRQRLFRYKLAAGNSRLERDASNSNRPFFRFGEGNSFVGDAIAHDWDNDYEHDAIYFGSVSGTEALARGELSRYVVENGSIERLIDTNRPVPFRPLLKRFDGNNWVFFGTGRYFTIDDVEVNTERNRFYGIYEPVDTTTGALTYAEVTNGELVDVTDVDVRVDGTLANGSPGGETSVDGLKTLIASDSKSGWFVDLDLAGNDPSRKISASPLSFRNFLFFTDFLPAIPDDDLCSGDFGFSFLNVVDLTTGVAPFTPDFDGPLGSENDILITSALIGDGYANQSFLFIGPDPETGKNRILIKTPLSTGQIADTEIAIPPGKSGRTSWQELEIQ